MASRRGFRLKKKININRVVTKIVVVILSLWVGGTILTEIGNVINATASPFYEGLSLIGWTVTDDVSGTTSSCGAGTGTIDNCVTNTSGSGILAVVGIIGIASVVMEFVEFSW